MTKQLIAAVSIIGLLTATASCRSTAPAVKTPQPTATASAAPALPDSIRWVRDSAEYQAVVLQTYRAATTSVEIAARSRQAGVVGGRARRRRDGHQQPAVPDRTGPGRADVHARKLAGVGRATRGHAPARSRRFPLARARPRRPHRHRHEPAGVRVPGHRGRLQDAPPGVRRDAVPSRHRTVRQEPALRGSRGRHHEGRRPAARTWWRLSATTSWTSRISARRQQRRTRQRSRRSASDTFWCPTPCTAAGNRR